MRTALSFSIALLLAGCQCGFTPLRVSVRRTDDAGVTRTVAYPPEPSLTISTRPQGSAR